MRFLRGISLLAGVLTACLLAPPGAQAELAPVEGQRLTVNIGKFPTSLDPGKATFERDLVVMNALFAPLYRSPGGTSGRLVPHLASAAPVVSNGGRTYTVPIRAAKWTDGTSITSADVRFAFTRARSTYAGSRFSAVTSVQTPSPRTIRFQLSAPVPWFDQLLASNVVTPVPAHVVKRHGDKWVLPRNIASSGPFRLESTRGASEIILLRNERWWSARRVRLQRLKLLAVSPASAGTLFDAKRLDATMRDTSIIRSQLARRRSDPRFRQVASGTGQYLFLNTRVPELASAATRRGIALAIDRAAITGITSSGLDQPLETIVPAGIRGSGTVAPAGGTLLGATGAPELGRARAELAAGGWPAASKLDIYYANVGVASAIATKVKSNLEAAGVAVELHPLTTAEFVKVGVGVSPLRADVDATLSGWAPDYSDPQDFHRLFTCANVDAGLNPSNYCDAAGYDATYAAATAFAPFATRLTSHRSLEERLTGPAGEMPAVPLYEPVGDLLVQPWVGGWVHHPSGLVDFERVAVKVVTDE